MIQCFTRSPLLFFSITHHSFPFFLQWRHLVYRSIMIRADVFFFISISSYVQNIMNHVLDNNIQTTATFKSESASIHMCVFKKKTKNGKNWKEIQLDIRSIIVCPWFSICPQLLFSIIEKHYLLHRVSSASLHRFNAKIPWFHILCFWGEKKIRKD